MDRTSRFMGTSAELKHKHRSELKSLYDRQTRILRDDLSVWQNVFDEYNLSEERFETAKEACADLRKRLNRLKSEYNSNFKALQ